MRGVSAARSGSTMVSMWRVPADVRHLPRPGQLALRLVVHADGEGGERLACSARLA
jgi:hypothetical protein